MYLFAKKLNNFWDQSEVLQALKRNYYSTIPNNTYAIVNNNSLDNCLRASWATKKDINRPQLTSVTIYKCIVATNEFKNGPD